MAFVIQPAEGRFHLRGEMMGLTLLASVWLVIGSMILYVQLAGVLVVPCEAGRRAAALLVGLSHRFTWIARVRYGGRSKAIVRDAMKADGARTYLHRLRGFRMPRLFGVEVYLIDGGNGLRNASDE